MSAGIARGGEILRGMLVESAPVRVGRIMHTAAAATRIEQIPDPHAAALLAGYEEGLRRGHAEGIATGREEGLELGRAKAAVESASAVRQAVAAAVETVQQQEGALRSLLRSLSAAMPACVDAAEDETVDLCFATICRVVGGVAVEPATVRLHLQHVLALAAPHRAAMLHVHPQDAELLEHAALVAGPVRPGQLPLCVADANVTLGGCIVHAGAKSLDARLETTMESFRAALLQARALRGRSGASA